MKELSIKEKAKAYDNVRDKIAIRFGSNVAKEIFSEYEDSEDERIRKSIIHLVKKSHEQGGYALHKDESEKMLDWLEKQCEQKPVELYNGDDYGIDGLWHAQRILEKTLGKVDGYQSDDGILEHKCAISAVNELSKQKPVVPKFIVGDTVRAKTMNDFVFTIKDITDKQYIDTNGGKFDIEGQDYLELIEQKSSWSEEDKEIINNIGEYLNCYGNYIADKNEEKAAKIYKSADWLKSFKGRVQSKQELSKEDEDAIAQAILALESMYDPDYPERHYAGYTLTFDKAAERLKSLRHQNRWKPSEEQIKAVEDAIEFLGCTKKVREDLKSLHGQLKKLMEE